jgi:type I restriction enzyme M protein
MSAHFKNVGTAVCLVNSKEGILRGARSVIFDSLLSEAKNQSLLALFGTVAVQAVEALFTERNGKHYFKCPVRGKEVQAKPEEIIRQLWIHRLVNHYRYPVSRITVEYPISFGRDTSKRADIVVFDADRPTVPYIILEVKQLTAKSGKEQLKSYTHATGAPLAVWSDGTQAIVWHRKNPNYFVELPDLPTVVQTIEEIVGQPWTLDTLIEKERQREAEGLKARSLRQLIEDMEDEVLANAGSSKQASTDAGG